MNNSRNRLRRFIYWRKIRNSLIKDINEPDYTTQDVEKHQLLKDLLSSLTVKDRSLVILHEMHGWTIPELAEMFDKPEGTIKIRLFRARSSMRKHVECLMSKSDRSPRTMEVSYALQRDYSKNRNAETERS